MHLSALIGLVHYEMKNTIVNVHLKWEVLYM